MDKIFENPPPFQFFDGQHLAVLLLGALLLMWLIFSARRWPGTLTQIQARVMALFLLAVYPLNFWIYPKMGYLHPWPMHLCDWAAICGAIALMTKGRTFVELTYFWALAGASNALITPDVNEGFPHPRFIVFFIHHIGIVVTGLWLTVGMGLSPQRHAVWRAMAWTQVFLVCAMVINHFTGHNYGFLAHKPVEAEGTLLDYLGPWPWYIVFLEIVCLFFFILLYLPWVFVFKYKQKRLRT